MNDVLVLFGAFLLDIFPLFIKGQVAQSGPFTFKQDSNDESAKLISCYMVVDTSIGDLLNFDYAFIEQEAERIFAHTNSLWSQFGIGFHLSKLVMEQNATFLTHSYANLVNLFYGKTYDFPNTGIKVLLVGREIPSKQQSQAGPVPKFCGKHVIILSYSNTKSTGYALSGVLLARSIGLLLGIREDSASCEKNCLGKNRCIMSNSPDNSVEAWSKCSRDEITKSLNDPQNAFCIKAAKAKLYRHSFCGNLMVELTESCDCSQGPHCVGCDIRTCTSLYDSKTTPQPPLDPETLCPVPKRCKPCRSDFVSVFLVPLLLAIAGITAMFTGFFLGTQKGPFKSFDSQSSLRSQMISKEKPFPKNFSMPKSLRGIPR